MRHATYSPSGLEKLELCPCFKQGESKDPKATESGTLNHQAVAEEDPNLCLTEDDEEQVQRCIDYKVSLRTAIKNPVSINEVRIEIPEVTWGTTDYFLFSKDGSSADLVDWKFGKFPVTPAKDNLQLQCYILGAFHAYPDIHTIQGHLVCPRQDIVTTHRYLRRDMELTEQRIKGVVERCNDPDKQPTPAEDACMFCGVKGSCPAMAKTAQDIAEGLDLPVVFKPGAILSPEDRAKAQVLSHIMEDWAKQIRKLNAAAAVEDGVEIPGFAIRSRKGTVSIVDNDGLVEALQNELPDLHVTDLILDVASVPFAKLVEALARITGAKKQYVREKFMSVLADVIKINDEVIYLQRERGKTYAEILEEATNDRS